MPPHELVNKILLSEQMITLYSTCMVALMGYVISQLSRLKYTSQQTGKSKPMTLHRDSATWLTLLVIIFMEDKGYDYSLF